MRAANPRTGRWAVVRLLVLVLTAGIATTGCSFIWVTRPAPKKQASEYSAFPDCTSSYLTPGLDTALVGFFGAAIANLSLNTPASTSRNYTLMADGAMGLTALASAIYGYYGVSKCSKARDAATREIGLTSQTFRSPPAVAPPPPAPAPVPLGNQRLAVLEFQGKNLEQDILMTFADTVRGGALQGLEGYGVAVMTRENMLVLLKDMGKQECGEGDCEVETARNIGADYVVSGKVVRMERIYVVTLKLHETKRGSLLGTDTVEGASQVDLLRSLREHARQLMAAGFGPSPDSAAPGR
jgi:hypothetical protein